LKKESENKKSLIEIIDVLKSRIVELQEANSYLNAKIRQYEQDTLDSHDEYTNEYTESQNSYERFF